MPIFCIFEFFNVNRERSLQIGIPILQIGIHYLKRPRRVKIGGMCLALWQRVSTNSCGPGSMPNPLSYSRDGIRLLALCMPGSYPPCYGGGGGRVRKRRRSRGAPPYPNSPLSFLSTSLPSLLLFFLSLRPLSSMLPILRPFWCFPPTLGKCMYEYLMYHGAVP